MATTPPFYITMHNLNVVEPLGQSECFDTGEHVAMYINCNNSALLSRRARRGSCKEAGARTKIDNVHTLGNFCRAHGLLRVQERTFGHPLNYILKNGRPLGSARHKQTLRTHWLVETRFNVLDDQTQLAVRCTVIDVNDYVADNARDIRG